MKRVVLLTGVMGVLLCGSAQASEVTLPCQGTKPVSSSCSGYVVLEAGESVTVRPESRVRAPAKHCRFVRYDHTGSYGGFANAGSATLFGGADVGALPPTDQIGSITYSTCRARPLLTVSADERLLLGLTIR